VPTVIRQLISLQLLHRLVADRGWPHSVGHRGFGPTSAGASDGVSWKTPIAAKRLLRAFTGNCRRPSAFQRIMLDAPQTRITGRLEIAGTHDDRMRWWPWQRRAHPHLPAERPESRSMPNALPG